MSFANTERSCWSAGGAAFSPQQRKALHDIGVCRTAALGGHVEQCDSCSQQLVAYNSCRNRHCPKCQSAARDRWLAERAEELLPVRYCHVVFTIPQALAALALQNQRVFYRLLFRAVSQTLLELAADPRRLGARIGFFAVLHTWSQSLLYHPHIHCVVTGRRDLPGRFALDSVPQEVLSARTSVEPALSWEVACLLVRGVCPRRVGVLRRVE